jgi:hypothetical protein
MRDSLAAQTVISLKPHPRAADPATSDHKSIGGPLSNESVPVPRRWVHPPAAPRRGSRTVTLNFKKLSHLSPSNLGHRCGASHTFEQSADDPDGRRSETRRLKWRHGLPQLIETKEKAKPWKCLGFNNLHNPLQQELLAAYFADLDGQAQRRKRLQLLIAQQVCAEPLMLRCMKLLGIGMINASPCSRSSAMCAASNGPRSSAGTIRSRLLKIGALITASTALLPSLRTAYEVCGLTGPGA